MTSNISTNHLDYADAAEAAEPRYGRSNQRVDGRGAGDRGRRQKPFESCGFGDAHEKTPGTLALGVSCQPVGSESSLPIERLPGTLTLQKTRSLS